MECTLTEQQVELVIALDKQQDCKILERAVRGKVLAGFQNLTLAFSIVVEKCLISLDTGLGKTLVATALMNVLGHRYPGKKWLVVVQNSNLSSTCKKIADGLYDLSITYSDADSGRVLRKFLRENMYKYDIFVISYEALCNATVNDFLFEMREEFIGMIVDESQTISNGTSTTARMLEAVMSYMRFRYMLTATPIRVHPFQIVNQIRMLDPEMFEGVNMAAYRRSFEVRKDGKLIGFKGLQRLRYDLAFRFVGTTRKEQGVKGDHHPRLILCDPLEEYAEVKKMDTFKEIKGDWDGPAMRAFRDLVLEKKAAGEKGIAHVNLTANKTILRDYLEQYDIRVGILDGFFTPKQAQKDAVHAQFVNDEFDVLLTNITTGKDLQCHWICFYELTFDFQQFVGRGERGLEKNDLELIFILVRHTEEIAYFRDNVYTRGMFLETISAKDLSDLQAAYDQLDADIRGQALAGFTGGGYAGAAGGMQWFDDDEVQDEEYDEDFDDE